MKKRRKHKPSVKLLNKHYPIGWGTGLTEKEWRKFAESYKPKTKAENKELMR